MDFSLKITLHDTQCKVPRCSDLMKGAIPHQPECKMPAWSALNHTYWWSGSQLAQPMYTEWLSEQVIYRNLFYKTSRTYFPHFTSVPVWTSVTIPPLPMAHCSCHRADSPTSSKKTELMTRGQMFSIMFLGILFSPLSNKWQSHASCSCKCEIPKIRLYERLPYFLD